MIVKLQPALKSYIWGGTKLNKKWGKSCESNVAESWELSFNPSGYSVIASGEHKGEILADVAGGADLGVNCNGFPFFPVLIKLIDAQENLSVQVHPSDDYALQNEGQFGKTEMWHILEADKNAVIYFGLNRTLSSEQYTQAVQNGTVLNYLNAVPVKKGETYFIESGTIHAIGAGVTLLEIQQNSTLTYRMYDYNRKDKNGLTRELHLDKAMQVANLSKYDIPNPERSGLLGKCKYFSSYLYSQSKEFCFADSFCSVTVIDGKITLADLELNKGETAFISAGERFAAKGSGTYVLTCVEK